MTEINKQSLYSYPQPTVRETFGAQFEERLFSVLQPARYIGGEFNVSFKPDNLVQCRLALAFPDIYDVGMSHHGFKILYELINSYPHFQAERVYAPWGDFEALLRETTTPLYMLESKKSMAHADIVGFTLQHETTYTNILNMLDLADIPLHSEMRGKQAPLIIAGGHGAYNPEPLSDFIDAFVIGDGETVLPLLMELYVTHGGKKNRQAVLEAWAGLDGVYIPSFYETSYNPGGTVKATVPIRSCAKPTVRRAVHNLREDTFPVRPLMSLTRIIHDRLAVEIRRGCSGGCRFCQAGMVTRPVRERSPKQIQEMIYEGLRNTGCEEVSLLSLSSADYTQILPLTRQLCAGLSKRAASINLPSLRINTFDVELADEIGHVRKSGFTFAPEAGTDRLRRVINKKVDEERFLQTAQAVIDRGWRTLKLYFMFGLPTETDEDLEGIALLANKIITMGRRKHGNAFQLNLSLSPFVPKSQTPFQWHGIPPLDELRRRLNLVRDRLDRRAAKLKPHNLDECRLEAVLARGDRRVGQAIEAAWRAGCKFDSWSDQLKMERWNSAFESCGLDTDFFVNRTRDLDETLPWDHIDAGPGKPYLKSELARAEAAEITPDCDSVICTGCAACDHKTVCNMLSKDLDEILEAPPADKTKQGTPVGILRVRLKFTKQGPLRFVSHLDIARCIQIIFRRCGIEIGYTQGFSPHPKMQFSAPLPLGFGSTAEIMDVSLARDYTTEDLLQKLKQLPLQGLNWLSAEEVPLHSPSIELLVRAVTYTLNFETPHDFSDAITAFHVAQTFPVKFSGRNGDKSRDLKQSVTALEQTSPHTLRITVRTAEGVYLNPLKATEFITGNPLSGTVYAERTDMSLLSLEEFEQQKQAVIAEKQAMNPPRTPKMEAKKDLS